MRDLVISGAFGLEFGIAVVESGVLEDGCSRVVTSLFVELEDNSLSGRSPPVALGTRFEELTIVFKCGLGDRSLISEPFTGSGTVGNTCSRVSMEEFLVGVEIDKGGGLRFLFIILESSDNSGEVLLLLSCRCNLGRLDLGVFDPALDGVSPRCIFESSVLSVICRLKEFLMVLPSLPARLLFTLTFPSMTFADGGG